MYFMFTDRTCWLNQMVNFLYLQRWIFFLILKWIIKSCRWFLFFESVKWCFQRRFWRSVEIYLRPIWRQITVSFPNSTFCNTFTFIDSRCNVWTGKKWVINNFWLTILRFVQKLRYFFRFFSNKWICCHLVGNFYWRFWWLIFSFIILLNFVTIPDYYIFTFSKVVNWYYCILKPCNFI